MLFGSRHIEVGFAAIDYSTFATMMATYAGTFSGAHRQRHATMALPLIATFGSLHYHE